jgi:hypothetical protein
MTFDDRVRRHLRDMGAEMSVPDGRLIDVRRRAVQRTRRRQAVRGGLGACAVVAVVGLSAVMLDSGAGDDIDVTVAGTGQVPEPSAPVTVTDSAEDAPADEAGATPGASSGVTTPERAVDDAEPEDTAPAETGLRTASTTTEGGTDTRPATWVQFAPPAAATAVSYDLVGGRLIARVGDRWHYDAGEGWKDLPKAPVAFASAAVAFDLDGVVNLIGAVDDGPCANALALATRDGSSWTVEVIDDSLPPGVGRVVVDARLRVAGAVGAALVVEELHLRPACLLDALEVAGTDVSVDGDSIAYRDEEGVIHVLDGDALTSLGADPVAVDLLGGDIRRRVTLGAGSGDRQWGRPVIVPPVEDLSLLMLDGRPVVETAGLLYPLDGADEPVDPFRGRQVTDVVARDGQVVGRRQMASWLVYDGVEVVERQRPVGLDKTDRVIDAVWTDGGWVVLYEDASEVRLAGSGTDVALAAVSGSDGGWARLGEVAGETWLVVETPVGQAVFRLVPG